VAGGTGLPLHAVVTHGDEMPLAHGSSANTAAGWHLETNKVDNLASRSSSS
jgi:hypothetical protein